MKIKPLTPPIKGKLILQYRGQNMVLRDDRISTQVQDIVFFEEKNVVGNNPVEICCIEVETFTYNIVYSLLLCFASKKIYYSDGSNERDKEWRLVDSPYDQFTNNEILFVEDTLYIIGGFTKLSPRTLAGAILEEYAYVITFDVSKNKNKIANMFNNAVSKYSEFKNDFKGAELLSELTLFNEIIACIN